MLRNALESEGKDKVKLSGIQGESTLGIIDNMKRTSTNPREIERLICKLTRKKEKHSQLKTNVEQKNAKVNFEWEEDREANFRLEKARVKNLYSSELKCSNWNQMGFMPYIQGQILENKKFREREHLLKRYSEGEFLSIDDLRYIADTSKLLNACSDKKFIKEAVNIIDKDTKENV